MSSLVFVLGLAGAGIASAQGFSVYEQGACMMGRGGAGVADPCQDGTGMFYNPAALSFNAKMFTFGGALIGPQGNFTDTSSTAMKGTISTLNSRYYPVPNIYMSLPFAKKYAFGVGVFAPYGLTTDWPETSQGRYLGYKSLVQGLYVQPTFAAKLNDRVSVGFGVDMTYLNVELRQRVDLSTQPLGTTGLTFAQLNLICPASVCGTVPAGTDFADVQLKGNTWHAGYHIGMQIKASDRLSFGFRYLGGQKINVNDGTIDTTQISVPGVKVPVSGSPGTFVTVDQAVASQFATGGKLSDQSAATSLPLPAQFVAGMAIKASQKVKLFFDYQWTDWSAFDKLAIDGQYLDNTIPEDYRSVSGFRVGTEIGLGKSAEFRAGYDVHGAAAPDQSVTPNLPEASRQELMLGLGAKLSKAFRFDFAYMYLHQPDRAGRSYAGSNPAAPTVADNNGIYSFMGHLFGLSMTVKF